MKYINCLSYDKYFSEYISNFMDGEVIGKIHSLFSNVINFSDEDNRLYTIAIRNIGNAPYTLIVDSISLDFKSCLLCGGDLLYKKNNNIMVKDQLQITNIDQCKLWEPKINYKGVFIPKIILKNKGYFSEIILENGSIGGALYYYTNNVLFDNTNEPGLIEKELSNRISSFKNSLRNDELSTNIVNSLIGFGIGLTPSGDDFLTGFLLALYTSTSNRITSISDKLRELIHESCSLTTDISKYMLLNAVDGLAKESLTSFIDAFYKDDKKNFVLSLNNILKIGSSSGTDMAVGVILAFDLMLEIN